MKKPSRKETARAVARKIRKQLVKSPEGNLQGAILSTAIVDLTAGGASGRQLRDSALVYINSDMPTVQLAGVEPDYVRRLLREAGLLAAAT